MHLILVLLVEIALDVEDDDYDENGLVDIHSVWLDDEDEVDVIQVIIDYDVADDEMEDVAVKHDAQLQHIEVDDEDEE